MEKAFKAFELYQNFVRSEETAHMFLDYLDFLVDSGELSEKDADILGYLSYYLNDID